MYKFILWTVFVIGAIQCKSAPKKDYLVQFWFYDKEPNGGVIEAIENYNDSITYDPNLPTNIITHGFRSSCTKMTVVVQAFQETGKYNNICVDWDAKTSAKQFFEARNLTPKIATHIANMIAALNMNPVHCVGHSLGAHICHMAAKKLRQQTGRTIQRATLCDPSVIQGDTIKKSAKRISENIDLTEVIHTNIEKIVFAGISGQHLGYTKPMGDFDFYPNGGFDQPSCNKQMKCEHSISYRYFAEALRNPMAFPSYSCSSLSKAKKGECITSDVYMGNPKSYVNSNRGIYWLSTENHENFGKTPAESISS